MSTQLTPFEFHSHKLRVIVDEHGEPWFVAKEVANILDYSDAHEMCSRLDEDEKSNRRIAGLGPATGGKGILTINESGLFMAILNSRKPEAKAFRKWVTGELLPSIRKTGGYGVPAKLPKDKKAEYERKIESQRAEYIKLAESFSQVASANGGLARRIEAMQEQAKTLTGERERELNAKLKALEAGRKPLETLLAAVLAENAALKDKCLGLSEFKIAALESRLVAQGGAA